ncbi:myotubularin-related protein 10 [Biomphalaria pfeifferi]|uniref:Myotubularin-related protein 10 n=1 Tax=Biomphalaria pfeifferi TaxID=112525 RepID=A0AAD8F704_BIOPF|nr:myotubularin-related protein 10 [Biomphalaria pfeifferi]
MSKRFKSYLTQFEMKEKGKATFQSYIDLPGDENGEVPVEEEEVEKDASAFFDNLLEPRKLQGERMIAGADSVLMFAPFSNGKQGISGHLFITNFKISFVTADKSSYPDGDNNQAPQRNKLLNNTDIPLTCVEAIYQVSSGDKRRRLLPGMNITTQTKYLEIHCKDFQIHSFGFKFTIKENAQKITDAIVRFSYPGKENLLFAFEFGHNSHLDEKPPPEFLEQGDWERELERLQCQSLWRVCNVNYGFHISDCLPEYFVIPSSLQNNDINKAAAQFVDNRIPTWSYTYCVNGASLVKMSQLQPESDFKNLEDKMLSAVKESSGNEKDLFVLDLSRHCPSLADVRTSHEKFRAIIMTDSAKDFYGSDSRWYSNLENSQWLQQVSSCLNVSNLVVNQMIRESVTVVLKEEYCCDMSCLVSSLVQLQLDPEYRTQEGFQSLVQREWVVMGHPFQKRLNLIWNANSETEQAPIFLLFLDCVWQLLQQFPSSFAFTETYLTSLWDTVHVGIFDTFLFNNVRHRRQFLQNGRRLTLLSLPSVWDWKFHLSDEQQLLFKNPLYMLRNIYDLDKVVESAKGALRHSGEKLRENCYRLHLGSSPPSTYMFALQDTVLRPEVTASLIKVWTQCYLRWIIPAQIVGGGNPSQYMQQCILAEEVICLRHKLQTLMDEAHGTQQTLGDESRRARGSRPNSGLLFGSTGYQTTSKHLSSVYITSSFPFSPGVSQHTQHSLICGPLSRYLKDTAIDPLDEAQDDD